MTRGRSSRLSSNSTRERVHVLRYTETYHEVELLMRTTYERGIEQGIERGIEQGMVQGKRWSALLVMEARFGALSPEVKQRVEALSPEALDRLLRDLLKAQTLKDPSLDD
jgi:Domain of unknown function (DUF4351)